MSGLACTDQLRFYLFGDQQRQAVSWHLQGGVVGTESYPVDHAANQYARADGQRALNRAVEDLLKGLLKG